MVVMSVLALGTLLSIVFFWRDWILAVVLLVLLGLLMMVIEGKWDSVLLYFIAFIFGSLSEIVAVHFGAWDYTLPQFAGISAWLPFVWGNAGLFMRRANEFIVYFFR